MDNFTDYWKEKKEVMQKMGVDEVTAKMIWNDCCYVVCAELVREIIKNPNAFSSYIKKSFWQQMFG